MIIPLNIHTHHAPCRPGQAIENCYPEEFRPLPDRYYSVGLHPWQVDAHWNTEERNLRIRQLTAAATHPQVLAIGEAGLDKLARAPLALQQTLFEQQARLAATTGKPLIIHLVRATDELLAIHRTLSTSLTHPLPPWIIHGFRGKAELAQTYLHHGFYLSFGERYQPEALCLTPSDRLLLETDESLLPVTELCRRAATLRGTSTEALAETVQGNVARLFFKRIGEQPSQKDTF